MLRPMLCPAGKNAKIISSKRQRQSWTPALPLFRPGFASQDNAPDGSEGAPSDTASAQGSPVHQVGCGWQAEDEGWALIESSCTPAWGADSSSRLSALSG